MVRMCCSTWNHLCSVFLPFVLFLPVCCIMVQGRSARTLSAVGLSTLCQELLGKPLGECCAVLWCAVLVWYLIVSPTTP